MDIFFTDPTDVPLPPDEVRIRTFTAQPWPDGRRVRVYLEITPFQKKPDGEIIITNRDGDELASISIIETIDPKMDFTLHLRGAERIGPFTASVRLFYTEKPSEDQEISSDQPKKMLVDNAETTFEIDADQRNST